MGNIVFHVYVAGRSPRNEQLLTLLRGAADAVLGEAGYRVEVIDLVRDPTIGETQKILALPTLARVAPGPEKRIIGNLNAESAAKAIQFLTDDIPLP